MESITHDPPWSEPSGPPMPKRVRIERSGNDLTVSWNWDRGLAIFLFFFAAIWFGILSVFWITAVRSGSITPALMTSLHAAVGTIVVYKALVNALNVTSVRANLDTVRVHTGPVPVRGGSMDIATATVDQLFVRREQTTNSKGRTRTTYEVHALTSDHRDVALAKHLPSEAVAHFVEHEIEEHLEIPDRHVPGSHRDERT